MRRRQIHTVGISSGLVLVALLVSATMAEESFYTRSDIFAFRPKENRAGQTIGRFGPVGIGIELTLPAFGMKIKSIEAGSPAAATGKLKTGQTIETINGAKLADIDPRIQLGNIITDAEATDGVIELMVKEGPEAGPESVVVKIPVLGSYSKTWPLNCKKSDSIVRGLADYLRGREAFTLSHLTGPAMLFMLSTGEEKDLAVVRRWAGELVETYKTPVDVAPIQNWTVGYGGVPLCEYYLRTGDGSVLPLIKMVADHAAWDMYNDGWAHGTYQGRRGDEARMAFPYMSGGHINACGVHVVTFLLMAKECGVAVDPRTLEASFRHFVRFAARGNVPYGDGIPEQSFVDNGKTGGLAFTMAAAANLMPNGEQSVYAQARDNSAVKGFYSTSWMLIGHTGGGVGEIWRSYAMGLMADRKPLKYREFMDSRKWFYELSRRHDGSFGIAGGGRYDRPESWGIMMGMSYTAPRKTLRLTGAPRTEHSNYHELPARPWGTAADDAFYSVEPAAREDGTAQDVDAETFAEHASRPAFAAMGDPAVSDDLLRQYAHHPDHGMRRGAAHYIARHGRDHLIPELLRADDPRVRHTGTMAIYCRFKRQPIDPARLTDEMVELLAGMIRNPDEAWWGVENALKAFALAEPDEIAPQLDRLLYWLRHDDWWLSAAAMAPLSEIAADERYYRKILPAVAGVMSADTHVVRMQTAGRLFSGLRKAGPDVQKLAAEVLCKAYSEFPTADALHGPGRIRMDYPVAYLLSLIGSYAAPFPGGLDALYVASRKRYPDQVLPHSKLYMKQDASRLSPALQEAVKAFKASEKE